MADQLVYKNTKKFRLVIKQGIRKINLGSIKFSSDGSLVFISKFHSDENIGLAVECGISRFKDNKFNFHVPEKSFPVKSGFHITLHPGNQKMHFRRHYPGEILYERTLNWFPVVAPFNLLYFYTLPLDLCKESLKKETFITPIEKNYKDSLLLKIEGIPNK